MKKSINETVKRETGKETEKEEKESGVLFMGMMIFFVVGAILIVLKLAGII